MASPAQHGNWDRHTSPMTHYGTNPEYNNNPMWGMMEGRRHRTNASVLAVIGLIVLPMILGPLAIWQATKAERLGVRAGLGKILGIIDLAFGVLLILYFISGG